MSINWRASLVPAAAVIPAPEAYTNIAVVKTLVVCLRVAGLPGFQCGGACVVLGTPCSLSTHTPLHNRTGFNPWTVCPCSQPFLSLPKRKQIDGERIVPAVSLLRWRSKWCLHPRHVVKTETLSQGKIWSPHLCVSGKYNSSPPPGPTIRQPWKTQCVQGISAPCDWNLPIH